MKQRLDVTPSCDWLSGYYQVANRLAVTDFLLSHGVPARLLLIYFLGDSAKGRDCPKTEKDWHGPLERQDSHLGLPPGHRLSRVVHKVFLPVLSKATKR